ncbi:uncharacterized protein LOC115628917 [Scaptodrosophila lebanonensis]|uniref:Uncharacterized protein LOC115628917 n=1 Tax=Drosophila lebanonensis TaxID=7225 RepID=A0A6J2TZE0_DROLE|nr:uncharacterized protein LOC115628917 [Scaptodrosophila lebanonensis]
MSHKFDPYPRLPTLDIYSDEEGCSDDSLCNTALKTHDPEKLYRALWQTAVLYPRLEDETPPRSFYEVLENDDIEFHCSNCGKMLISMSTQTMERCLLDQCNDSTQTESVMGSTSTLTSPRVLSHDAEPILQLQRGTVENLNSNPSSSASRSARRRRMYKMWSLVKTIMVLSSMLQCAYTLYSVGRTLLLNRMLAPNPMVPILPPPSFSPWNYLVGKMYELTVSAGRKLHII